MTVAGVDDGKLGDQIAHLGGGFPLVGTCMIANNGLSLTIPTALIDTGANGYILVNELTAERMMQRLGAEIRDFPPHPVGGFEGGTTQYITRRIKGHMRIQGFGFNDQWMLVAKMRHPMIIGRKWLDYHDILVDCRRRRLLPPPSMERPFLTKEISVDATPPVSDPKFEEDVLRREKLMQEEDARRRNGRANVKAIRLRIAELEAPPTTSLVAIEPQKPVWRPQSIEQRVPVSDSRDRSIRTINKMERRLAFHDGDVEVSPLQAKPHSRRPPPRTLL
jgi:hypothetical protein